MSVCIKDLIKNINLVIGCTNKCPYCYARINCIRFHETDDFSVPEFFERKLRMLEKKIPGAYLLTGQSDFADWKEDWIEKTFEKIRENPQNQFIFLTKNPEKLNVKTDLQNVWIGTTVTCAADKHRFTVLKENVECPNLHATLEPLHSDVGELDLDGYNWLVIGTETGKRKGKIDARPKWVDGVVRQAQARNIPVFMKEELVRNIMGEERCIQQLPECFPLKPADLEV